MEDSLQAIVHELIMLRAEMASLNSYIRANLRYAGTGATDTYIQANLRSARPMTWHEKLIKARMALPGRTKQRALDAMLGLRPGTISEYETGRVKKAPARLQPVWDEKLGTQIPWSWIVNGHDDPVPLPRAHPVNPSEPL